jgi:hypothetical protein
MRVRFLASSLILVALSADAQLQICVAPYTSMIACNGSDVPSGYEADFLKSILSSLVSSSYTQYGNVSWNCLPDVPSMMTQLQLPASSRTCDLAIGGIVQSNLTSALGIRTSFASWNGGLEILIYQTFPPDMWMFLKPFDR